MGNIDEAAIVTDALDWALENGLKVPLSAKLEWKSCRFCVLVEESAGKKRTANLWFTAAGARSMYERLR